jgi:hypothetical protein
LAGKRLGRGEILMERTMRALLIAIVPVLAAAGPSAAAPFCPEGRTRSGTCVHAGLADDLRTTAIVLSQPKLSFAGPPVLPEQVEAYAVPADRGDLRRNHRPRTR